MATAERASRAAAGLGPLVLLLAIPRPVCALDCRPIEALPVTIHEPGRHCLTASLRSRSEEGAAITVMADGVTIDLRGHRLGGQGAATAIEALDRREVTVRDGTIVGFGQGVRLAGARSGHHVVEKMVVQVFGVGVSVEGRHNIVRDNVLTSAGRTAASAARGIVAHGALARVMGNEVRIRGAATGIEIAQADGSIVERNVLIGENGPTGTAGVHVSSGTDVLVLRNEMRDVGGGIVWSPGAGGVGRANVIRRIGRAAVEESDVEDAP